jgi:hypothetical protein
MGTINSDGERSMILSFTRDITNTEPRFFRIPAYHQGIKKLTLYEE